MSSVLDFGARKRRKKKERRAVRKAEEAERLEEELQAKREGEFAAFERRSLLGGRAGSTQIGIRSILGG